MDRRRFLGSLAALAAGVTRVHGDGAGRGWFDPRHRQLFLDDAGIARVTGMTRVVNPPTRHPANPLIVPDQPWESRCQVYGTALYDEALKRFRLWYLTIPKDRGLEPLHVGDRLRAPHTTLVAYAESDDGIHWLKPDLSQFSYDGDVHNNLIDLGRDNCEGISVLLDATDPHRTRRWKAVYWDHGSGGITTRDGQPYSEDGPDDGFCVATSPDGLHWTPSAANPVIRAYCDTGQNLVYDPGLRRYVAFSRFGLGRKLARSESADFAQWTTPELVLECDEPDGPGTQIYGAGIDLYHGIYLAMLWIYREGTDGTIDTQLACSRDGRQWTRVGDRATWLALGEPGTWEGGMVRPCGRIIRHDDELWVYYCGTDIAHAGPNVTRQTPKHPSSIGLATLRADGFVSLDAGDRLGSVLTKPFPLPPGRLNLNADASRGSISVSVCSPEGRPLPGLSGLGPIVGNHTNLVLAIAPEALERLHGRPVSLLFGCRLAKLYSYGFMRAEAQPATP